MTIKDLEEYRRLKNEVRQIAESLEKLLSNQNNLVFDTVKGSGHVLPYQERVIAVAVGRPRPGNDQHHGDPA